ncbi:hypothetical protein M0Q39_05330, partial [Patescibacteria group bacterium]|nr:hypothetical protein [Patescibacteria group bacterium]
MSTLIKYGESLISSTKISSDRTDPTGFIDRTSSTISFTNLTRTFTIAPTGSNFIIYQNGISYTKLTESIIISNTEGIHIIYYDNGILYDGTGLTISQVSNIIRTKAIVCIIYWDVTNQEAIYVGEERHGIQMDGSTHVYLHYTFGLQYLSGLGLGNFVIGDGSLDTHSQFSIDSGDVADEDIYLPISAIISTTGLPIYYMLSTGQWRKEINTGYSVLKTGIVGEDRLAYNQYTGGAWQLTEVTNNDFVLCHIFATTEKDNPLIAIVGQDQYINIDDAKDGSESEIRSLILNNILFPEIHPIASIIFQTSDSYSNTTKSKIVLTAEGDNYIDWRSKFVSRVELTSSDHNELINLQGGAVGEYYHLTAAENAVLKNVYTDGTTVRIRNTADSLDAPITASTGSFNAPPIITTFAGTVSSSGTTVTFSSTADAILAGYCVTDPQFGTTIIVGGQTRYISSWISSTQCTVTVAPSPAWSSTAITSIQGPINILLKNDGTCGGWVDANGNLYVVGSTNVIGSVSAGLKVVTQAATDTLTAAECRGCVISNYGQAADNTQTLPAAAEGLHGLVVIGTAGAGAFHL